MLNPLSLIMQAVISQYPDRPSFSIRPDSIPAGGTFTRGTLATQVNADGIIGWAPHNLLLRSNELTSTQWLKRGTLTVTTGTTVVNGVQLYKLNGISSQSQADIYQITPTNSVLSNRSYTFGFWIKRVSTSGIIRVSNPQNDNFGMIEVDLSLLTDSPLFITPTISHPAITLINSFNFDTNGQGGIYFRSPVISNLTIEVGLFQLNAGTILFSYNPTIGSQYHGIRNADYSDDPIRPGIKLEPQATNLLTQSENFVDASWSKSNTTVVSNNIVSPDGRQAGDVVSNTVNLGSHFSSSGVTLANNTTYTRSIYVKYVVGSPIFAFEYHTGNGALSSVQYNVSTGVVVNNGSAGNSVAKIFSAGNGWYRCVHTFTTNVTGTPAAHVYYIGAYGSTALSTTMGVWGAQLEQSAFPTSYIPTFSTAVTRGADVISYPTTAIGGWDGVDGTFVTQLQQGNGNSLMIGIGDNVGQEYMTLRTTGHGVWTTQSSVNTNSGAIVGSKFKSGTSFGPNGISVSQNDSIPVSSNQTFPNMGAVTLISLFQQNSRPNPISLYSLDFYPLALPVARLQVLTK